MRIAAIAAAALLLICFAAQAQGRAFVRAAGQATLSAKPDQVQIDFGVVTQAQTAQEAANTNATQVAAVLGALQTTLGSGADIKTVNYSLSPVYSYPSGGQPVLTGYTASNYVEVITGQIAQIGRLIDIGIQAGANRVQSLRFTLKDDQPLRVQALQQATVQAKQHADAMAAGLGVRTGAVISVQESGAVSVVPYDARVAAPGAATTTPIESGQVSVSASVTLEIELYP